MNFHCLPWPYCATPSNAVVWVGFALTASLYFATLAAVQAFADAEAPSLPDLGHALLPEYPALKAPTDWIGVAALCWVLWEGYVAKNGPLMRWVVSWISFGWVLSATLHSGTVVSDGRWVRGSHRMGIEAIFGGFADRLLSNHVYGLGVALLAAETKQLITLRTISAALVGYGVLILMAREHYTVDVVLAMWAVLAVRLYTEKAPPRRQRPKGRDGTSE